MGLLGSLLSGPLGTIVLLGTPERTAALDLLVAKLIEQTGADHEKARMAVRMSIQDGEARLLDTPEGCAVILQDATEVVGFIE